MYIYTYIYIYFFLIYLFDYIRSCFCNRRDLVPPPGVKPGPRALEVFLRCLIGFLIFGFRIERDLKIDIYVKNQFLKSDGRSNASQDFTLNRQYARWQV